MYCQDCGAEVGTGRFCRKCGAASGTATLSVQAAATPVAPPDYEKGLKKLFMGLAFLIIAIFPLFTSGKFWWWMLFPAVPLLAAGIAEFARGRHTAALMPSRTASLRAEQEQVQPVTQSGLPRARNTAELVPPPPSVTEDATRRLNKDRAR